MRDKVLENKRIPLLNRGALRIFPNAALMREDG
jgi:hypothetical protein